MKEWEFVQEKKSEGGYLRENLSKNLFTYLVFYINNNTFIVL